METDGKRILFLDGMGCNPEGFKTRFLRELGYRVTTPLLPDLDFDRAVAVAEQALVESAADVIVGYSRGGGVAMMLDDRRTPRILIAPALHWVADGRGFEGKLRILHSGTDDSLPFDELTAHLVRCDLSMHGLRRVGDDHTMIDEAALSALTAAVHEFTAE